MFELTNSELKDLRSKNSSTNSSANSNTLLNVLSRLIKIKAKIADLIDSRWNDEVKDVLNKKFPNTIEDEWKILGSILFI